MADALADLNEMIERIRREADAAGYARAWTEIRDVAATMAGTALDQHQSAPKPTQALMVSSASENSTPVPRASRGENRKYVREAMSESSRALNATEIQLEITKTTDRQIAYSSVKQALGQLEAEQVVFRGDDHRWRFREQPQIAEETPEAF